MNIQYRFPRFFDFLISLIYTKKYMKRFSDEIGSHHTVFEVAAGYGRMNRYMDSSNTYYGIDLNTIFVDYGKKQGLDLYVKDALDRKSYKRSDIFVVVDFVHHISEHKLKILFDLIFSHADKKVVVVEPAMLDFTSRFGIFGELAGWLLARFDSDGFNRIHRFFSEEEYDRLFKNRFGSKIGENFDFDCIQLDGHYLVTFTKNKL